MKKILIAVLAFISLGSTAQEQWNLSKCINHAYENNIQLKQQELNVKYAKNNDLQSKLDMLPSLNANFSHDFKFGRSVNYSDNSVVNSNYQSTGASVGLGVTLFNGFKKVNTIKRNNLTLKSKEKDVEKSKSDLAINVAGIYLQVLYNIEMLNIAKEQLAISKE